MTKQVIVNGSTELKPHFVLVPLVAQGHMIPMVDMARLIASRGATVSLITTPVNAARIRSVIDRVAADKLPIRFVELNFRCAEAGLPEGCENVDLVPSKELFKPFFLGLDLLQEPLEAYIREAKPAASCMIVDYCNSWASEVARRLDLPRMIFHGPSCFFSLSVYSLRVHKVYEGVDEFEPVVVPNLPQRIEITRAQAPGWFASNDWEDVRKRAEDEEATADGFIENTFHDLEPEIVERYSKATGKPVWPIGPLCLCNKDVASKAIRGKESSIDEHQLLSWLDSMEPKSVVFVSFGSLVRMKASQLIEIGIGLEASNRPFIWVIKDADRSTAEFEKWMAEGFEERVRDRSLMITGWAPQVAILSHPSVGGFVTHCGWNSILEAVSTGVPMITWPHFADQFLNEKLIVEVLKIGVAIGVKVPFYLAKEDEALVKSVELANAISSLMDGGEEGERRRERVEKLGENARRAMEEGGTSYENLTRLIEYIVERSEYEVEV